MPALLSADPCLLRSTRLFMTGGHVVPGESGIKAPLAWERWTPSS